MLRKMHVPALALFGVVVASLMLSPSAEAKVVSTPTTLSCNVSSSCFAPSKGNAAVLQPDLSGYVSLSQVCITMQFSKDLLDPNEEIDLTVVSTDGSIGAANGTTTSQATRQLCTQDTLFLDDLLGRGRVTAFMFAGSSKLVSVTMVLTGTQVQA